MTPRMWVRGKAPPGIEQYWGCEHYEICGEYEKGTVDRPARVSFCSNDHPMNVRIYKRPPDRS